MLIGGSRLSQDTLRNLRVPTPPPPVAAKIADYLDHETAEIDAFITDQSRFIDLIEERTSVLIETIITGKQPGTTLRKESGSAWVGDIPNHWEMERISGPSRFVVNGPVVAGIHATVFAALVSRIRVR